jgi:hypothetical protein
MDAERIIKLTPDTIRELIEAIRIESEPRHARGKRSEERWPFPGTVEVWLPDDSYGERHVLATLHNLSAGGLAMRTRRPISTDTRLSIAVHQPAMSLYGHGVTRHCTRAPVGYLVGVEFTFSDDVDTL